jgi:hypothetical protein
MLIGPENRTQAQDSNGTESLLPGLLYYLIGRYNLSDATYGIITISFIPYLSTLRHFWLATRLAGNFSVSSEHYIMASISCGTESLCAYAIHQGIVTIFMWFVGITPYCAALTEMAKHKYFQIPLGALSALLAQLLSPVHRLANLYSLYRRSRTVIPRTELLQSKLRNAPMYRYCLLAPREIRLLKLNRVSFFSRITRYELKTAPLNNLPPYRTISYTWGSNKEDYYIEIDGQHLPVTLNVAMILADLTSFWSTQYLWIDQVCINQKDENEKSAQVQLMREIYRNSESVIAWLSPFISQERLSTITPEWELCNYRPVKLRPDESYSIYSFSGDNIVDYSMLYPSMKTTVRVLAHQFWQRMWIIQEITLAPRITILHNGQLINWDLLCLFASQHQNHGYESLVHPMETHGEVRSFGQNPNMNISIHTLIGLRQIHMLAELRRMVHLGDNLSPFELLVLSAPSLSSDPKDKLFALFGVMEVFQGNRVDNGKEFRENIY